MYRSRDPASSPVREILEKGGHLFVKNPTNRINRINISKEIIHMLCLPEAFTDSISCLEVCNASRQFEGYCGRLGTIQKG